MAAWVRELLKYAVLLLPWALKFLKVWLDYKVAKSERNRLAQRVVVEADGKADAIAQFKVSADRAGTLRDRLQQHLEAERLRRPVRPGGGGE